MTQHQAPIVAITPELAREWLQANTHNRKISQVTVDKYARDMANGQWLLTNQGIGFDEDGVLLDGQHRLLAVIKSGATIKQIVVRGLPKIENETYTQDVVDMGRARSVGDVLSLSRNMTNAAIKVAIANCIISILKGVTISLSPSMAAKIIDIYKDEIEFVLDDRPAAAKRISSSPILAAMVFAAKVNLDMVISFKDKYFKGIDLPLGSPALTLRNYFLARNNIDTGRAYRKTIFHFTTLALMHYSMDSSLKLLKISTRGTEYFENKQKGTIKMITGYVG